MSGTRRGGLQAGSPAVLPARAWLALALLFGSALLASGCGLGAGKAPSAVGLVVTRDFGARIVRGASAPKVRGQETVMSLLTRNAKVTTHYSGAFVQSIDGIAGGQEGGELVDWFYYVNGIEASKGAASTNVHPGDQIWWDRRDWSESDDVPAVVGSFPQPFLNGIGGKRLPVRVECADATSEACRTVTKRLRAQGVPAAVSALGSGAGATHTLRVAVGPWRKISGEFAIRELARGPQASGVYARFAPSGTTLVLLNAQGRAVQTLAAGAGLIAATRSGEDAPVWAVTGTDEAGVESAARDFDRQTLRNRFAVAIRPSGPLALPRPGA
jgi:hypothetical protein